MKLKETIALFEKETWIQISTKKGTDWQIPEEYYKWIGAPIAIYAHDNVDEVINLMGNCEVVSLGVTKLKQEDDKGKKIRAIAIHITKPISVGFVDSNGN